MRGFRSISLKGPGELCLPYSFLIRLAAGHAFTTEQKLHYLSNPQFEDNNPGTLLSFQSAAWQD